MCEGRVYGILCVQHTIYSLNLGGAIVLKKFLSVLILVLLFSSSSVAEGVDLKTMSIDDLIALKNAITDEIYSRLDFSFEDTKIGAGYYLVGEDIKAGKYEFICTSAETESFSSGYEWSHGIVCVASSADDDAVKVIEFGEIQVGEKYKFELKEGQVLVIARCNGLIKEYSHSWTP